jgi:hypothetical protein
MPVELDVTNPNGRLAAGMYPAVKWPVRGKQPVLLVPPTSVVSTSERVFVIRVKDGIAEWVNVRKGSAQGDLIEVIGPLAEGDTILRAAAAMRYARAHTSTFAKCERNPFPLRKLPGRLQIPPPLSTQRLQKRHHTSSSSWSESCSGLMFWSRFCS